MNKPCLFFISLFGCILLSCKEKPVKIIEADLSALTDTSSLILQYEGLQAGGGQEVVKKQVQYKNTVVSIEERKAIILFTDSSGYVDATPTSIMLPADWKSFTCLRIILENPNTFDIQTNLQIIGARNVLGKKNRIGAHKKISSHILLYDLPLTARNINLYQPNSIRIEARGTQTDYSLRVHSISLLQYADSSMKAVVDKFGQRKHQQWEGKMREENEFVSDLEKETKELEHFPLSDDFDKYLGWKKGPLFSATGFFRIEQNNGRWWLVTPEGHAFWSLGVTGVRTKYIHADVTIIKGREHLFDSLPPMEGMAAEAYSGDSCFSFYAWNIIRKYKSKDAWKALVFKRLQHWGLNTVGNWSEESLLRICEMPFTKSFRTTETDGYYIRRGLPDPFDVRWQKLADSIISEATDFKNNPWLIGYFIDNEGPWNNLKLLYDTAHTASYRDEWVKMIKKKYLYLSAVNKAWETNFQSWQEIKAINRTSLSENTAFQTDYIELEKMYTEKYFSFVTSTLKKYDPNHLYLGCRFTRQIKPLHILEIAGKYSDVVTVNVYRLYPDREEMQAWYDAVKKPLLIGEHHLPLSSQRQLPPKYQAFSPEERYNHYINYIRQWAQMPFSLGAHWYQFVDQHITGRASDGENQTVGLVDITDRPYKEMINAMQKASATMYEWHSAAK